MNIYTVLAILVVLIVSIVALCIAMSSASKVSSMINYSKDANLIDDIRRYYSKVLDIEERISLKTDDALIARMNRLEEAMRHNYSKTTVVSFDAFDDVTGNLSFALTLLNDNNDGIILTSLYGHNSQNTYIRTVVSGKCDTKLLAEEIQSLQKAIEL